ncbi:neuronal acetylcholine receptor subunit alpha-9-like [Acanthaster planci]|uniref:Neuronal acetylcholine receptor subunit alpha-9-like n=1 Tax=Acanthaster planci TaxID=133434 RepID=A0A8B7YT27_ACAPL|nr:neuronal acetylcholine receptor subunit alpha-9-like [Acanthaster planci]
MASNIIWLGLLLVFCGVLKGTKATLYEYELLQDMFTNYSSIVRPVINASESIEVRLGAALQQIIEMDEKNQVLTVNLWMRMQWTDSNFLWDPADYGGTDTLIVPINSIWRPDIVLYTNADSGFSGMMETNAAITNTGIVYWNAPAIYTSTCKIDVSFFPFDEQRCPLKFGSWAYNGFQIDLVNRSLSGDTSAYIDNGEWELVGMPVRNNIAYYLCCVAPFPDVTFTIVIRRRPLFYLFNLLVPCMLISLITVLDFYLPADSGEKVTLGITILLALIVFLLLVAETMPPTSEVVPLIGQYYLATIVLVSGSTAMTVFVLYLHYRLPGTKPVPSWLRTLTFHYLARILCLRSAVKVAPDAQRSEVVENNHFSNGNAQKDKSYKTNGNNISTVTLPPLISERFERNVNSILDEIKYLTNRAKESDSEEDLLTEWKYVAMVFDRMFMWIFLITTIVTTIGILCQPKPYTLREDLCLDATPDEARLFADLFQCLNPAIRPVDNISEPVLVTVGAAIQMIVELDERNQLITTSLWMRFSWEDSQLHWNPDDYGGVKSFTVPLHNIWKPDIVLYNNADAEFQGMIDTGPRISHRGMVYWNTPALFKSSCHLNMAYFPFDEQRCFLKFGSWSYHGFEIDLTNRSVSGDMSNFIDNGEFDVIDMPVSRNLVYYKCCPMPFPDITFTLVLKRRPYFYLFNLLLPSLLVCFVTALNFLLPADSGEKVSLVLTVLLAMTVFLLLVAEIIPASDATPVIGKYLISTIVIVSLSVVMTVFVLHLHYRLPGAKPVPLWLRKLAFVYLASLLCVQVSYSHGKPVLPSHFNGNPHPHPVITTQNGKRKKRSWWISTVDDNPVFAELARTVAAINDNLHTIVTRGNEQDADDDILTQWKYVALVFDRLFFCVYIVLTSMTAVIILGQSKYYSE